MLRWHLKLVYFFSNQSDSDFSIILRCAATSRRSASMLLSQILDGSEGSLAFFSIILISKSTSFAKAKGRMASTCNLVQRVAATRVVLSFISSFAVRIHTRICPVLPTSSNKRRAVNRNVRNGPPSVRRRGLLLPPLKKVLNSFTGVY
jgi:hypothetical protein